MNRDEIICHCMGVTRGEIEDAIKEKNSQQLKRLAKLHQQELDVADVKTVSKIS